MERPEHKVSVMPGGEGVVALYKDAVVVITRLEPLTSRFLTLLRATTEVGALPWRIARLLAEHSDEPIGPFGVYLPLPSGGVVLLHGSARAEIADLDGVHNAAGNDAYTWMDKMVPESATTVSVFLTETAAEVDPQSDLRAGVVPGAGFIVQSATNAAPEPDRIADAHAEPEPTQRAAPPLERTAPSPRPFPPPSETMAVQAVVATLVADDGKSVPLDRNYVMGREPWRHESVRLGRAVPLVVEDEDDLVSRVQAHIAVADEQVTIQDGQSANGTFAAAPGSTDWTRVGSEPMRLEPGWSIRLGKRVYTYRTSPDSDLEVRGR
ncbi:FHA domain-containing protein [Rhodococcus sp. NPDC058521]|uniref:FHA domain-containing protein n=1 Tax=Rhodococcus sp. NPDC058521 TaxID=3346536 RepID=UPI003665CE9C